MNRFIPQYEPCILEEDVKAVMQQMNSGWVGCGSTVESFESKICLLGGHKHCISTTSGTTAIIMALKSFNLRPGSTIVFPNYTFLAAANAAKFLGFNIKLVDVKSDTLCMDPTKIPFDDKDVSCIIFVNHNGYVGPDVSFTRLRCDVHHIKMLEDSSQALGISNAGKTGHAGIYSFSVPKVVTTGQGGCVVTEDDEVATECKKLRDHGDNWRKTKCHQFLGVNFKFNDILASYGLSQLERFDSILMTRTKIFNQYRKYIKLKDFGYDATWMVVYETLNADEVIAKLADKKIQAVKYYLPVNWNDVYKTDEKFEVSELMYSTLVYLPSSLNLTEEEVVLIGETING